MRPSIYVERSMYVERGTQVFYSLSRVCRVPKGRVWSHHGLIRAGQPGNVRRRVQRDNLTPQQ